MKIIFLNKLIEYYNFTKSHYKCVIDLLQISIEILNKQNKLLDPKQDNVLQTFLMLENFSNFIYGN